MSWLSDIVKDIKQYVSSSVDGNVFIGSDINAIDTAYSDSVNHYTSMFFVPLDSVSASDENGILVKKRFACYIFVPKSDDPDGVDAWEICDSLTNQIMSSLSLVTGNYTLEFVSGRIFREGRGYFIYVNEFTATMLSSTTTNKSRVALYLYTGETNGDATYKKTVYNNSVVSNTYGVTRSTSGIDDTYGISAFLPDNDIEGIGQKSWVIVEGMGDVDKTYLSQSDAEVDGSRPFEINSWSYVKLGSNVVGVEVNGV